MKHTTNRRATNDRKSTGMRALLVLALLLSWSVGTATAEPASTSPSTSDSPASKPRLDRSGKAQHGKASFYGRGFVGKPMADGTPMNPNADAAASKTLPLGTTAKVTNLRNGKSAVVEIKDRGPYVKGRIVDLTPKTAGDLGMRHAGVVPVEVEPIEVPQPDGSVKPGVGAADTESEPVAATGKGANPSNEETASPAPLP